MNKQKKNLINKSYVNFKKYKSHLKIINLDQIKLK